MKTIGDELANNVIDVIRKLREENARLREALKILRIKEHYECEDGWYSCPKADGYLGEDDKEHCSCGMDKQNAIIDAAL